jgi:hypothetical protein
MKMCPQASSALYALTEESVPLKICTDVQTTEEALYELTIQRLHMLSWVAPLTREASTLMHVRP